MQAQDDLVVIANALGKKKSRHKWSMSPIHAGHRRAMKANEHWH